MTITPLYLLAQGGPTGTMRSYRVIIPSGELAFEGFDATQIRVKFLGPSSGNYYISGASIGRRSGSTIGYVSGEYVRLQFGGNNYVRVETSIPEFSDWIDTPAWFDYESNLMIHFDLSGESSTPYVAKTGGGYRRDGTYTDCMVESPTGYTAVDYSYGITEIHGQINDGLSQLVYTYDSGGAGSLPNGYSPDFSSASTMESWTDEDLSVLGLKVIHDCYDSQLHNLTGQILVTGGSNASPSVNRRFRSSPNCSVPFTGKAGTGATFYCTSTGYFAGLSEPYLRFENLCFTQNTTNTPSYPLGLMGPSGYAIRLVLYDLSGESNRGLYAEEDSLVYSCIVYGGTGYGVYAYPLSGDENLVICNTVCDNGWGFVVGGAFSSHIIFFSNYGGGNSSYDFGNDGKIGYAGWNASSDATADLAGDAGDNYKNSLDLLSSLDADYLPTTSSGFSANGSAGDRYGRNPYDDVTATYDQFDFFKNDTSGEADSFLDILENTRPNSTSADSAWSVGAAEYEAPSPGGSGEIGLPFITLF